jgi:chlorophyll synthase
LIQYIFLFPLTLVTFVLPLGSHSEKLNMSSKIIDEPVLTTTPRPVASELSPERRHLIEQAQRNVNQSGFRLSPRAVLSLMKPVTWFPPVWAYLCGAISTGVSLRDNFPMLSLGLLLAGPLMCAMSQTMNDYFDREVDAINEPQRPIPAGLISKSGSWAITTTLIISGLTIAYIIHPLVMMISALSVCLSFVYSAPPFRAKSNGWYGNLVVGFAYEGIAWLTGSFAVAKAVPHPAVIGLAVLFSLGAHGIMTLNDFKSVVGDRLQGVKSIPVQLGERRAAILAVIVMDVAQILAIGVVLIYHQWIAAIVMMALLAVQLPMQKILVQSPKEKAIWYNAFGTLLYVLSMLVSAIGIGSFQ